MGFTVSHFTNRVFRTTARLARSSQGAGGGGETFLDLQGMFAPVLSSNPPCKAAAGLRSDEANAPAYLGRAFGGQRPTSALLGMPPSLIGRLSDSDPTTEAHQAVWKPV